MDDGLVNTGFVRGVQDTTTLSNTPATSYIETGTTSYTICRAF